jgi:hypothetical protein
MYKEILKPIIDDNKHLIIINYIRDHQPCTKEEIVNGVSNSLSRVTVYKGLDELLKQKILSDRKIPGNRRDHQLSINDENPLLILKQRMESFKLVFIDLVQSSEQGMKALRGKYTLPEQVIKLHGFQWYVMIEIPMYIRDIITELYTSVSLSLWPSKISNKNTIRELNSIFFSTMSEVLTEYSALNSVKKFQYELIIKATSAREHKLVTKESLDKDLSMCYELYSFLSIRDKFEIIANIISTQCNELEEFVDKAQLEMYNRMDLIEEQRSKERVNSDLSSQEEEYQQELKGELVTPIHEIPDFLKLKK